MEAGKKPKITSENLIEYATAGLNSNTDEAYRIYTNEVIELYPLQYVNFDVYDKEMKTLRARLSQAIGAANKSGKGAIIHYYAVQFSNATDLNMSAREADDIFKQTVGRSMSKQLWTGLFHREANNISPYFTDKKYRKKIFMHPLVIALQSHMDEFELVLEQWNKTRKNPYQEKLNKGMTEAKRHSLQKI